MIEAYYINESFSEIEKINYVIKKGQPLQKSVV
jgi:hypothetical protein